MARRNQTVPIGASGESHDVLKTHGRTTPKSKATPRREEEVDLSVVKAALDKAKTKDEVISVWKEYYLTIGHRKMGRLLLGRNPKDI